MAPNHPITVSTFSLVECLSHDLRNVPIGPIIPTRNVRPLLLFKYGRTTYKSTTIWIAVVQVTSVNVNGKMPDDSSVISKIQNIIHLTFLDFCRPSTLNFFIRAVCLFILGISLSCVLNVMLILPELRRKVVYERDILDRLYATTWWFTPSCGTASTLIGLIYPCIDSRLGERHHLRTDWSSVVRCAALFMGIAHAVVVSL